MSANNSPKAINRWDRVVRYSAYGLIVLAAFSGFCYVYTFGVNLYWSDEWEVIPVLFQKYDDGNLTLAEFWKSHNEHCIFFPKLVLFGLGILTNGNSLANMYFIEFLLVIILAVFIVAFRKQFRSGQSIWLMVPVAFLVFSLRQYENMLLGLQVNFILTIAAALCAFLGLSRVTNEKYAALFGSAISAALVSAYSSGQGIMVWPVGLCIILIAPLAKRLKISLLACWTGVGAAAWLFFFLNWNKPENDPAFKISYLLTLIGSSLSNNENIALLAGALILALAASAVVIVLLGRQWIEQSFWLAAMAFSSASMGGITVGRSVYGASQAMLSRYTSFSILLIVGTCIILASQSGKKYARICAVLACITFCLVVLGTSVAFFDGLMIGRDFREHLKWQQFIISTIESQPDDMIEIQADKAFPRKYAGVLKKLKFNVFADPEVCYPYRLPDPSLPGIDSATRAEIHGIVSLGPLMSIRGWAVDWPARDLAGGVAVVIDGVPHYTHYGLENDQAVKYLVSDKYLLSGFNCTVSVSEIGPGTHTISLKVLSRDCKGIYSVPDAFTFEIQ
jgi:hypothetical protein